MRLIHFTAEPLVEIWPVLQPPEPAPKPKGLWVSDEDDYGWREWCTTEEFRLGHLAVAHEITLAPDANILQVTDTEGIDGLTRQYRAAGYERGGYRLDWAAIAGQWQGILITPYIFNRRLSLHCGWYYPWDCASGCIWNSEAIEGFTVVELEPLAVQP